MTSRVPSLGPRGEGWVVGQVILFAVIAGAGLAQLQANGWVTPGGARAVALGLVAIGLGGFVAIRALWDLRGGISPFPRPVDGAPLIESGAYRLVRHPIYSGIVLAALGWGLVTGSLVVLVATGLLFLLFAGKSLREEAWLSAAHPGYRAYQQRTKRLIPWVY